jgi:hypothetical protein
LGTYTEHADQVRDARQRLTETVHELAQCRAALRAGGDPETLGGWITQAAAQERAAQADLQAALSASSTALRVEDVEALVRELGGVVAILKDADPSDRAALYEALKIAASYDPTNQNGGTATGTRVGSKARRRAVNRGFRLASPTVG